MDYTLWQVRGVNQDILNRVSALEESKLDRDKVTQGSAVTEPGFAVDARELNAGMEGTMAHGMELLKNSAFPYNGDLADADSADRTGIYRVIGNTRNAPFQWGLLVCFHVAAWIVQIGKGCSVTDSMLYVRTIDNFGNASATPNWSAWKSVAMQ